MIKNSRQYSDSIESITQKDPITWVAGNLEVEGVNPLQTFMKDTWGICTVYKILNEIRERLQITLAEKTWKLNIYIEVAYHVLGIVVFQVHLSV